MDGPSKNDYNITVLGNRNCVLYILRNNWYFLISPFFMLYNYDVLNTR